MMWYVGNWGNYVCVGKGCKENICTFPFAMNPICFKKKKRDLIKGKKRKEFF